MSGPQAVNREDDLAFVKNFVRDIPPLTRVLFFGTLLCTSLSLAGLLPVQLFILDWRALAFRFQIWRPFFSVLNAGAPGFHFLIHLYFVYMYSRQLEVNNFFGRTSAYAWMLAVCLAVITALAAVLGFPLAGPAMLMVIMHVWGRYASDTRVMLYGIVPIPAKYLSLAVLALNTVLNGRISMADVAGVVTGQLYYFVDAVYPTMPGGRVLISVPPWFERVINSIGDAGNRALGLGAAARTQVTGPRPGGTLSNAPRGSATGDRRPGLSQPQPRRHHWGAGRTLGSS